VDRIRAVFVGAATREKNQRRNGHARDDAFTSRCLQGCEGCGRTHTLEIFRRRSGAEISPLAVFEYLLAEKVAEWGHYLAPDKTSETPEDEDATAPEEDDAPDTDSPAESETEAGPVFPWAESIDTDPVMQPSLFESEAVAEADYESDLEYKRMRDLVLERDGWKCTVPYCSARSQLTVHHIQYRSRGVCHSPLEQPVNRTADYTGADQYPSWSPDGSQIAFQSDRDGGGYFVMSALGGSARKVFSKQGGGSPQWSTDGEELARLVRDGSVEIVEIVSMRTRESRRLALPSERNGAMDLSWSSNGRFFAFVDGGPAHDLTRLWTIRANDGQASAVWSPSWSPDGSRLHFVSNRGGSMDLWSLRVGPNAEPEDSPQPVTVAVGMRHAVFSPDDTKLAYSRGRQVANLWRVPILDDRPATWADAQQLTFEEAYIERVDVSPDGERLLVQSDRSGNMDLWMLPRDGGEWMQVTSEPAPD